MIRAINFLRRVILLTLIVIGLFSMTAGGVLLAGPAAQDDDPPPSITPTETATFSGPPPTATATLSPPPIGGGRVAVFILAVRAAPTKDIHAIGGLKYGDEVFPIGQSVNGNWIAIEWEGDTGWILSRFVSWHIDLDLASLPVFFPSLETITPGTPSVDDEASPTPSDAATDTPEPTFTPSQASGIITPEASFTPSPTETPEASQTPTETLLPEASATAEQAVVPEVSPEPTTSPETSPTPIELSPQFMIILAGGIVSLLMILYGWRRIARGQELKRYREGFILHTCPTCQTGTLQLDEQAKRQFGIPRIKRSVRCDNCRSLLRGVTTGKWRYSIDPFINPQLAEEYNGQVFDDSELFEFAEKAYAYTLPDPSEDHEEFSEPSAEELVSGWEERYHKEREAEEEAAERAEEEAQREADEAESVQDESDEDIE